MPCPVYTVSPLKPKKPTTWLHARNLWGSDSCYESGTLGLLQFLRLGRIGYTAVMQNCWYLSQYLAERLEKTGYFRVGYPLPLLLLVESAW